MKTSNNEIQFLKDARDLLICIDMVNGFVKEGVLAAPSLMRVVPRQQELLKEALESDDAGIIFIRDSHPVNATEFAAFPPHCIEGSEESEVIDELKEYEKYSLEYLKNSTNLMFAPRLMEDLMKFDKLTRIRIMGCLSEICVENGAIGLKTFFDQMNRNVEVCVHSDAVDTYDAKGHDANEINQKALKRINNNGINILGGKR